MKTKTYLSLPVSVYMYTVVASVKFNRQILSDITNLALSTILLSRVPCTSDLTRQCDAEYTVTLNLTLGFTVQFVCSIKKPGFTYS
jgi:hypothetical protein